MDERKEEEDDRDQIYAKALNSVFVLNFLQACMEVFVVGFKEMINISV